MCVYYRVCGKVSMCKPWECMSKQLCRWKVGQLRPGSTIQFKKVSYSHALHLEEGVRAWFHSLRSCVESGSFDNLPNSVLSLKPREKLEDSIMLVNGSQRTSERPRAIFRQVGSIFLSDWEFFLH
jgi:hypothetical protein